MTNKLLTPRQCSKEFQIGYNRLLRLIKTEPDIPIVHIGSRAKIPTQMFSKWLEKCVAEGRQL